MNLKKILALLVAAVMLLAMSATALAADGDLATATIPITKTIYFKNADSVKVYEPNIKYTYTVTAPTAAELNGVEITDDAGVTVTVKPGKLAAFSEPSVDILFSSAHKQASTSADGSTGVVKGTYFTFDPNQLKVDGVLSPGVYRYIITETSNVTPAAAGIERGVNYDNTLILNVFVSNTGVDGATILDPGNTGDTDDPVSEAVDNKDKGNDTGKTAGPGDSPVTPADPENPTDPSDPTSPTQTTGEFTLSDNVAETLAKSDLYTTYNLTVTKKVTGSMGDKSNLFPFQTVITNSIADAAFDSQVATGAKVKQTVDAGGTKTLGALAAAVVDGFQLKDGQSLYLYGVPSNQTSEVSVQVNEFNNTGDTYKVTGKFGTDYLQYSENSETKNLSEVSIAKATATNTNAKSMKLTATPTVEYTNNLDAISPTGVVLRFAPYFAMMAGGTALFLVLFLKRRKNEEEEA